MPEARERMTHVSSANPKVQGVPIALLLASSLILGLAQVSLLPPWEGFDETAHFSYIQQIAETGSWPNREGKISSEVEEYAKVAPTPYPSVPPWDTTGHWTYYRFFASAADVIEVGNRAINVPRAAHRTWQPGIGVNWQAQHPS